MNSLPSRLAIVLLVSGAGCATTGVVSEKNKAAARIHYDLGVSSFQQNDLRASLRDLLQAVDKDPNLHQAHNALGLVYHAMARHEDSLEHYEKAVELFPKFSEAHNNLGTLLIDLGRYDDAIVHFEIALGDILYRSPSLAEGNLGWAHFKKGDTQKGVKHLKNAVATNPKFCRGYEWLARIGLEVDTPDDVVANIKRFRKHCMADANIAQGITEAYQREMTYYLALGYLKQGERDAAKEAFADCAVEDAEVGFGKKCLTSLQGLQ